MKLSIMFLTYNRPEMAKRTLLHNLSNLGLNEEDYELLICDQGTEDEQFIAWLASLRSSYLRLNRYNEGIARSLNQLIIRSSGKHLFFLPDDFILPDQWAKTLIHYADQIRDSGIVGFEGQDLKLPTRIVDGLGIQANPYPSLDNNFQVFGAVLITRQLISLIGGFCEDFHPYGHEDSDYCLRAIVAGLLCYYIPGLRSEHIGDDGTNKANTEKAFFSNIGLFRWRAINIKRIGVYVPLPIGREAFV